MILMVSVFCCAWFIYFKIAECSNILIYNVSGRKEADGCYCPLSVAVDKLRQREVKFPRSDSKGGNIWNASRSYDLPVEKLQHLSVSGFFFFFFLVLFKYFTKLLHMDIFLSRGQSLNIAKRIGTSSRLSCKKLIPGSQASFLIHNIPQCFSLQRSGPFSTNHFYWGLGGRGTY